MAVPDLYVSFTSLQTVAAAPGPSFDPQMRYSQVWKCNPYNVVTFIRQNDYTCQVSRAFLHDDEYYSVNYYQSGSGNLISSSQFEVDFTAGDYMIGAKEQTCDDPLTAYGSPQVFTQESAVYVTDSVVGDIDDTGTPDSVVAFTATGTVPPVVVAGTQVLKWTFKNVIATTLAGGRLKVTGSSIPSANFTWNILNNDLAGVYYTETVNTNGGTVSPGTFVGSGGGGGAAETLPMAFYVIPDLPNSYSDVTSQFAVGGTMVVAGDPVSANNGSKTIERVIMQLPIYGPFTPFRMTVWINRGSEAQSTSGTQTATITTLQNNRWIFSATNFDDAVLIGPHTLIVEDSSFGLNGVLVNNDFAAPGAPITDVPSVHTIEVSATSTIPEIFTPSAAAKITIRVPDDVTVYTFFLQDLTVTYDLIGAYIVVANDTFDPVNNATYKITDVDPDPSHHIVYATPTDGRTDFRSQLFYADDQSITILQQTNVQPEYQPCWLMVPLTGTKPVVGRWEYGIAYADWRYEGAATPNLFPGCVSSPVRNDDAWTFVLPYRAISFTVGQTAVTTTGQVINAAVSSNASTVGLKQFAMHDEMGLASNVSGEMLLPGPMCGEFTASGFHENGVNFGFERPFVVSQQESASGVGLRIGGKYQIVVVAEVTDEDGDRVFSIPSPPLDFQMNASNNSVTYGGRMLQPLDSDGIAVLQHFGVTNYRLLSISIYRTSYQDDVPTTDHHKITLDLNVNGLAPVSDNNDSGFSFPDEFTWNYLDENLDAAILPAEVLYTDKGYLPRFPAPAQRGSVFWKNRSWCIGYDGAVWMSGEKKEGDATWFFPLFRYVLPTIDKPVSLAEMDDYLEVQCERSLWYIPAATFPDSTGRGGTLPAPIQLPFTNGGTGHAMTLRAGVAYSSSAGGVWMVTRGHENIWLSQPIQDSLGSQAIVGMTVDKRQRLHVTTSSGVIFVYDQVVQEWYRWIVAPASLPHYITTLDGEAAFQDASHVWLSNPASYADNLDTVLSGIPLDIELASLQFGVVRNLKAVWEMQLIGTYRGEHHLNAVLSYPDDDPDNPTTFPDPADGPYTPDPTAPYLIAINPMIEQASSYGLRVFADFTDIDVPGNSFELEVIGCEVGVDSTSGLDKMKDSRRIVGS